MSLPTCIHGCLSTPPAEFVGSVHDRTLRIPESISFDYLPFGYQQPDTRPWTLIVNERQIIKDSCYNSREDWIGTADCFGRGRFPERYPDRDDRYHSSNVVYRTV